MNINKNLEDKKQNSTFFKDFDFTNFWDNDQYAIENYIGEYPDDELIQSVENELGFKLPESYIDFMRIQNGGIPKKNCFAVKGTSWSENYIAIDGIYSIGSKKNYSILGNFSTQFWIDEWGYPDTGIYICDSPCCWN